MHADPDRRTGRTHKMLLRTLAQCGDPNVKNAVVVSGTVQLSHNLFIDFCKIAKADPFCEVTDVDYNFRKVTVNGTTLRFIHLFQEVSGFPLNSVWEEDHETENATMTLRQFRRYESTKTICTRMGST